MPLSKPFLALIPVKSVAIELQVTCFRLSAFPFGAGIGLVTTLIHGSDVANVYVEIVTGGKTSPPTEWVNVVGQNIIEKQRMGSLVERLSDLGVWTLGECIGNMQDGSELFHEAATIDKEHRIHMLNPRRHPNTAYEQIVRLYSVEFLDYGLTSPAEKKRLLSK